jgi:hypothetical protein
MVMQLSILSAAILAVVFSVSAASAQTRVLENFKFSGNGAIATFTSVDGDLLTTAFVMTIANKSREPPQEVGPVSDPLTSVSIEVSRISDGEILVSAFGSTISFSFTVDRKFETARLQAIVLMSDASQNTFNTVVDLVWTATARAFQSHDHTAFFDTDYVHTTIHSVGKHRDAVATGSIEGNVPDVGLIEFAPETSTSAEIQTNKGGAVTVETR